MKLEGYSNYEIYPETGQVWSYRNNRFLGGKNEWGYITTTLTDDNGKHQHWRLNRLIWTVVNGEIPKRMEINHLDENKENNSIHNLSLVTPKENVNWGTHNERVGLALLNHPKKSKPVLGYKNDKVYYYFPSTQEAKRFGFIQGSVARCARGERNAYQGYKWQYQDDFLADWWNKEYMF